MRSLSKVQNEIKLTEDVHVVHAEQHGLAPEPSAAGDEDGDPGLSLREAHDLPELAHVDADKEDLDVDGAAVVLDADVSLLDS